MRNELYSFIGEYLSESNIGLKDIVFAAGCLMACMMIAMLIIIIRQAMLMKKYKKFMQGSDARSLEEELRDRMNIIDKLDGRLSSIEKNNTHISTKLDEVFQKIGIVKYDAFEEMGGKMSFALALLSDKNTGFVINAMHSREGCYTYIKEITDGKAKVLLAKEEKEALEQALLSDANI
jgi:hypothetical protein